jgi:two-component system phosphate regulon response regulator PhoB
LLADDDPDFVTLCKAYLEERGWRTVVARDALQASTVARRDLPDAVILDINMPGGSGIRALKQLKASPRVKAIPIIVVSGREDEQLPRTVIELGAVAFVRKPLALPDLHQRLVQLLGEPASQPAGRPQGVAP